LSEREHVAHVVRNVFAVMRGQHDLHAPGGQVPDHSQRDRAGRRVQPIERLVEQQQSARSDDRAREQHKTQLSIRELARPTHAQLEHADTSEGAAGRFALAGCRRRI
jgi:hypothetical protein